MSHDTICADDRALTDGDAFHYEAILPQPRSAANAHRLYLFGQRGQSFRP